MKGNIKIMTTIIASAKAILTSAFSQPPQLDVQTTLTLNAACRKARATDAPTPKP